MLLSEFQCDLVVFDSCSGLFVHVVGDRTGPEVRPASPVVVGCIGDEGQEAVAQVVLAWLGQRGRVVLPDLQQRQVPRVIRYGGECGRGVVGVAAEVVVDGDFGLGQREGRAFGGVVRLRGGEEVDGGGPCGPVS
ncbi:hypothetical protein [Kribbella solani]|uniref:Uncharacterized protein n=1 Tax=Kribbella solani TaxID=236067 RepID=A0A841DGS3_9ACTN|nr:hypothetical protein [Kribbella solani]